MILGTGCEKATAGVEKARPATADQSGFTFAAYGDSRSMMVLPDQENQKAEAQKLMVDMFSLAMPEKVSEAVVKKHVKMTYDPTSRELIQVVMPFMTKSEVTTLRLDKGWSRRPRSKTSSCCQG
jgi:hypothetical protein